MKQELESADEYGVGVIHARVYGVIREAAERLAGRDGWQRHIPWLISSIGEALNIAHAFVYKNYPDKDDVLTAVRLYRWSNPLKRNVEHLSEPRVSRYEGVYLGYLAEELSARRSVLCSIRNPLPPLREYMEANGVDRVVTVPIFAGDEWWGFIGIEDSAIQPTGSTGSLSTTATNDVLRTAATILGEAIRGASLDQALRWSERLQRVQRDIALTATSGDDRRAALDNLLRLICELGEFDAAAIDIDADARRRIGSVGNPPEGEPDGWCESCRPTFSGTDESCAAVYGDSTMLEFCEHSCPVHEAGFHSYGVVPIVFEGAAAATLSLFSSRRSTVPTAVRQSIEAIGNEIGMIIAMVRAEEEREAYSRSAARLGQRHALAMDAGRVGVWEYLPDRRAFIVDRAFLDFIDWPGPGSAVPEARALECVPAADRRSIVSVLHRHPTEWSGSFSREIRLSCGSHRWVLIRGEPVASEDGRIRLVGTVADISVLERYRDSAHDGVR